MATAAFLLLVSSVGVGFGWQPMPDGSPRVEYLVRIEPEMLTALQAGSTIPIVSEVPEDVGPIGRVRIVIGTEALPRQNLPVSHRTIRRKPNLDASGARTSRKPPTGVQQAQFTTPVPASGGYSQPAAAPQPSGTPAPSLPGNPSGGSSFEKAIAAGEKQAAAARAEATQAVSAQASELQSGLSRQLQRTTDSFQQVPSMPRITGGPSPGWPGVTPHVPAERSDVGGSSPPAGVQANGARAAGSTAILRGAAPIHGQPPVSGNASPAGLGVSSSQPVGTYRGQRLDQPVPAGSARPASGAGQSYGGTPPAAVAGGDGQPGGNFPTGVADYRARASAGPGFPVASRNGQGGNVPGARAGETKVQKMRDSSFASATPSSQASNAPRPPQYSQGAGAEGRVARNEQRDAQLQDRSQTSSEVGPGMFTLLLAWVLLFGSVAGNLYLFWSYLDIRGKYQMVIYGNRGASQQYSRAG